VNEMLATSRENEVKEAIKKKLYKHNCTRTIELMNRLHTKYGGSFADADESWAVMREMLQLYYEDCPECFLTPDQED
jgi:hypothetical protein